MKTTFFTFALLLIAAGLQAETGRSVMEKSNNLPEPKSLESSMSMEIHKAGETENRSVQVRAVKAGANEKVLLEITSPYSMKVLTHTDRKGDDLQWVKLRNGQVKQIANQDRKTPFENSHLFYEDLRSRNIDDYTYEILGDATVNKMSCWKIRGVPKKGKSIYDKADFYIIKQGDSQYFAAMIEIYYNGYLYKRLVNYDIKKIDGIITPGKSIMFRIDKDGKNLGRTVLKLDSIKYNISLPASIFNSAGL